MKRNYLRNIGGAIVFFGIAVYLLCHITYVLREQTGDKTDLMGFYAEPQNSLDMVFIGSSSLRASIDPVLLYDQHGITSYVISTSAQSPLAIPYLITEAKKYQEDALYIIDLANCRYSRETWDKQNEGSLRGVTDGLKYSINRVNCIAALVPENKTEYLFDIIKYHDNWEQLYDLSSWNFDKHNILKGHRLVEEITKLDRIYYTGDSAAKNFNWDEEAIIDILNYCSRNNINALFMVSLQNRINYADYEFVNAIVQSAGYDFFCFNEYLDEMGINFETDFYDGSHPNCQGAVKATEYFGDWIHEQYPVSEKTDSVKSTWDSDVVMWKDALQASLDALAVNIANYLSFEVISSMEDSIGTFVTNTDTALTVEFGWYVERETDAGYERIYTREYTADPSLTFDFSGQAAGTYRIKVFIRNNEFDIKKSHVAAFVVYDFESESWKLQS